MAQRHATAAKESTVRYEISVEKKTKSSPVGPDCRNLQLRYNIFNIYNVFCIDHKSIYYDSNAEIPMSLNTALKTHISSLKSSPPSHS